MNDSLSVESLLARVSRALRYSLRDLDDTVVIYRICSALAKAGVLVKSTVDRQQITSQTLSDGTECHYAQVTLDVVYHAPDGSWLATRAIGRGSGSLDAATNRAIEDANWIALVITLRFGPAELSGAAA